ncbi:MAG: 6-carboxytetrahydropterin synthase QueD [bacterium]|nr:6-carboxytetrahydropterin synthase QueD [bacterium]
MAYTIFKDFTFSAAHRLPGHPGACRYMHGHNYRVRVFLGATELDELGMVMDFNHLKALIREVAGRFDHRVINEVPPFDVRTPTAEMLSEFVFRGLEERLEASAGGDRRRVTLRRVEVWENDSSCAIFEP